MIRAEVFGLGLEGNHQSVTQDIRGHRLHVLRGDVGTPREERVALGSAMQGDGGPCARPELDQPAEVEPVLRRVPGRPVLQQLVKNI